MSDLVADPEVSELLVGDGELRYRNVRITRDAIEWYENPKFARPKKSVRRIDVRAIRYKFDYVHDDARMYLIAAIIYAAIAGVTLLLWHGTHLSEHDAPFGMPVAIAIAMLSQRGPILQVEMSTGKRRAFALGKRVDEAAIARLVARAGEVGATIER